MSMLMHSESRRLYSWWWDSHISPKNSKWLQENLTDMDMKVKAMIKLLEEEADSFARRAEMYYKKRPELLKLVEEFYRAYRALAERYDHATGALRHAHRTMAEAFPNHIPLALPDESLTNSSITEAGPQTPEKSTPRAPFDPDDLQKDAFGVPMHFNSIHRNGSRVEENEALANKKGLKHFNEIFSPREGIARVKLPDGKVRKGINFHDDEGIARVKIPEPNVRKGPNFQEEEENAPRPKIHIDSLNHLVQEPKERENVRYEIKHLQEEVSQFSIDNQKLKSQIVLESKYLDFTRTEVQNLKDVVTNIESEKETALLQNQLSQESISSLEIELSKLKDEIKKLNEEMEMAVLKLSSAEKQCLALEKANQSLQSELEKARGELEELKMSLQGSDQKRVQAEMSLQSSEKLYNQSQEKVMLMELEIQALVDKLKEIEHSKEVLEEEVCQLKDMNYSLNEYNLSCALKIEHLQDEIISLKEINGKLEGEIEIHAESKKILQQELDSLKDDRNELGLKHQSLTEQMEVSSMHIESLEVLVKELKYDQAELKEICRKLEDEKLLLINKLKDMESVSERNAVLENSLSDANVELEELRKKIQVLEDSCEFLNAAVSTHVGEKAALASQIEALAENLEKLSEKITLLENSLDDANTELEGLRSKFRNLEESCLSLSNANSDLIAEKNDLISQVESIQNILANLETIHAILEDKHSNLVKEKNVSDKEILKLEDSLSVMQKEHESLIQSNNTCLATLENQLHLMQKDRQCKAEELEVAQQRCLSHMTENFILQRSLCDMTDFLIVEKQKYKSHIQSSEIQLAALESQIHLLEEERKVGDIKIEEEEQKSMHSMLENFILQKCLSEMKEDYFTLLQECQKHLEAARCSDELIKQLEGRNLAQNENISLQVEYISKLRDGIHLLLKPLNINKELMHINGSEVIILQTIFDEIKNLLVSVSDSRNENQLLRMEISIYLNLLKEIGLEKVLLGQELGRINQQSLALQREHDQLLEAYEQVRHDMSDSDCTNKELNAEMESLTRELEDLLEELYKLREEKNALEEESSLICAEAMTLEHLYVFFSGLNVESKQQLKFLGGDIFSLLAVKHDLDEEIKGSKASLRAVEDENRQLKDSLVLLEELKSRTIVSQFDLFTTSDFCKELVLQVEAGENLLKERSMELSVAKNMLQSKQEEVEEVCRKLMASNENVGEAKKMRFELEKNITVLLEDGTCKDKEIVNAYEENRTLNEELDRFNVQVEVLRMREQHLSSEMQKEKEEVDRCEGEMMELFNEVQVSVVNASVLEDKLFELAVASEGLEISAMVHREKLNEEFALKNAHAVELKRKFDDLENENGRLRTNLNSFWPLIISLRNGIAYVEEHVCQLAKLHGKKDNPSSFYQEEKAHETSTVDHATTAGVLEMQNLIAKVEALQKLLTDTKSHLNQEEVQSAANLESARREVEKLKLKVISCREEKHEPVTSNGKHGVVIKDIELDQVSNSIGVAKILGAESDEQMLKLWETSERNNNNRLSNGHDTEVGDEVKSKKPSSALVAEKEVSIDKLEISREINESQEGWNRRVIKRLASDAKKLSALQAGAEEVKAKLDKSGEISTPHRSSIKLGTLKGKLKEAEEAISELADSNVTLKKKVEGYSTSNNGKEMGHEERRQVSEQARSASDRIGMLELELQKIHYIFLKLEEEWENYSIDGGDQTPRVLLRDYLYGRKGRQGKKRPSFCGLIRPRITEDDH